MKLQRTFWALLFVSVLASGCSGSNTPIRHPVKGVVQVNGKPAERMAVLFHLKEKEIDSSLRFPTGVTDAEGRFQLSSISKNDGAIEGKYAVTFSWLSSSELSAYDMLDGMYGDAASSEYEIEIPDMASGELIFDLTIPEAQIRRPSGNLEGADPAQSSNEVPEN